MDILVGLLLQLQNAQLQLSQLQSARSARTEVRVTRPASTPTVTPISKPVTTVTPKPVATQPAPATQSPSDLVSQIEQYVLSETNAARAQNGLAALTTDSQVAAVARAHSQDMLSRNYFEHTNLSGCNPGCRLSNAGYQWRSYGENIHWMSGYKLSAQDSAKKIVNDWMNSPGHRANILGAFKYAGVGIAVSGDKIYSTTDYTTK